MKRQYRFERDIQCKTRLCIYHDGKLVDSKKLWIDDAGEEADKLELDGYVYGYTKEEVIKAKEEYEKMLKNIIQ